MMARLVASLPMYDADRAAVEAWWLAIAARLQRLGPLDTPKTLEWPDDLDAHWQDPRLLLSQMCGYNLATSLAGKVQVIGAFRYTAPGCSGIDYRSELVAREGEGRSLEDFRARVAVINSVDSHSGCNSLRALIAPLATDGAFFSDWRASGSHRRSLAALRSGEADIAAIDAITLAGLVRHEPGTMEGLRLIGSTALAPGLPLVTSLSTTEADAGLLRDAIRSACSDPELASLRASLFIDGFEFAPAERWHSIEVLRQQSEPLLWREPVPRLL